MRILMLTQYYAPEPHDKFTDLAADLAERGHQVHVLTGFPCYPAGRTYPGYRQRLCVTEEHNGVRVTRMPQFPDHSRNVIRRAVYYLSFALSAATIGLWRSGRADIVLVYQAALPVGFAGWLISRVRRAPLVLDVVDLWPDSVSATGMLTNQYAIGRIERLAKWLYAKAEHLCVITNGYKSRLLEMGVRSNKLSVVYMWSRNGGAGGAVTPPKKKTVSTAKFTCLYAGAVGPCQALETLVDAADQLRERRDIQIVIVGDGVALESVRGRAASLKLSNIEFRGRRPLCELPPLMLSADALVLHLKSDPMSRVSIPSKTIDYLSVGKPVIAAIEGEAARLIDQHNCGVTTPPEDATALADAIAFLADHPEQAGAMGLAARRTCETHFNRQRQVDRFDSILRQVVDPNPIATTTARAA